MPRHHLVPRMLLNRFAAKGMLMAVPRGGGPPVQMTSTRACTETDYYQLELEPEHQAEFPPERVESILSHYEGRADRIFTQLTAGDAGISDWQRFDLTLFLSLQLARGWAFRNDLSDLGTLRTRFDIRHGAWDQSIQRILARQGKPADWEAIMEQRKALLDSGWRLRPSGSHAVQLMLYYALELVHPRLFLGRHIRVIRFDDPMLLTSDEPVALWARPSRDLVQSPMGIANADAIWMPMDRRHALALTRGATEGMSRGTPVRAGQINRAVAAGAVRWIFQNPKDAPIDVGQLPDRPTWAAGPAELAETPDELRVRQLVRRRHGT